MKFYEYALKNGWVDSLPFDFEEIRVSRDKSFLAHTDTYGSRRGYCRYNA